MTPPNENIIKRFIGPLLAIYNKAVRNFPFLKYSSVLIATICILAIAGYLKLKNSDVFIYAFGVLAISLLGFALSLLLNKRDAFYNVLLKVLITCTILTMCAAILGIASFIFTEKPKFYFRIFPPQSLDDATTVAKSVEKGKTSRQRNNLHTMVNTIKVEQDTPNVHIDSVIFMNLKNQRALAIDVILSNDGASNMLIKRAILHNFLEQRISRMAPYLSTAIYHVTVDSISLTKSTTKISSGKIGLNAFEHNDRSFYYRGAGTFQIENSEGNASYDLVVQFPLYFELPSKSLGRIRLVFGGFTKQLKKSSHKGADVAHSSSGISKVYLNLTLFSNQNRFITYSLSNYQLLESLLMDGSSQEDQ